MAEKAEQEAVGGFYVAPLSAGRVTLTSPSPPSARGQIVTIHPQPGELNLNLILQTQPWYPKQGNESFHYRI